MYKSSPATPLAERLEYVRRLEGFHTLKAFWEALTADGGYKVSYEAVRNYHFNREPPISYISQVANVFGVRLEYLINDEWPVLIKDVEALKLIEEAQEKQTEEGKQIMEEVFDSFPYLQNFPISVQTLFLEVWSSYSGTGWVHSQVPYHLHPEYGRNIARLLLAPFEVLASNPTIMTDAFADYAVAALQALNLATRVPKATKTKEKK